LSSGLQYVGNQLSRHSGVIALLAGLSFCAVSFYAYLLRKKCNELSVPRDVYIDQESGAMLLKIDKLESVRQMLEYFVKVFSFDEEKDTDITFIKKIRFFMENNTLSLLDTSKENLDSLREMYEYFKQINQLAVNFVEQVTEKNGELQIPPYSVRHITANKYGAVISEYVRINPFYEALGLEKSDFLTSFVIDMFGKSKYRTTTLRFMKDAEEYLEHIIGINEAITGSLNNGRGWSSEVPALTINLGLLEEYATERRVGFNPFLAPSPSKKQDVPREEKVFEATR